MTALNIFDAHNKRPFVMAHRGNSAHCPENTMVAFQRAADEGTDVIETDLHLSSDGVFMCIHDATLERTTNGHGEVRMHTAAQLVELSASYGHTEFTSERIPTLRQTLEWLPTKVAIGLELKSDDFLEEQVCKKLQNLLIETNTLDRAFALSFSTARMRAVRSYAPRIPTGVITMRRLLPDHAGELIGPFWPLLLLNPLYPWLAHRRGQLICPLDPTPEPRLSFYRWLGCDAVLTNDPGLTLKRLGRK